MNKIFKAVAILAVFGILTGCESENATMGAPASPWKMYQDKQIESKAFDACMAALPAGPKETVYNDWSEVVDSCRDAAKDQATVYKRHVGGGVWVTQEEWAKSH